MQDTDDALEQVVFGSKENKSGYEMNEGFVPELDVTKIRRKKNTTYGKLQTPRASFRMLD